VRALHTSPCTLAPSLRASPSSGLLDQVARVTAEGLPPSVPVILTTKLRNDKERINFKSTNTFVTTSKGRIDTALQAPVSGNYSGVHSSGPLWSVRPQPGSVKRLWPGDITQPLDYTLSLSDTASEDLLASTSVTRSYLSEGVRRVEVREDGFVGTLFLPPHPSPAPAIITLYGGMTRNGVPEDRAAMLASKGYATLALAYFGVGDLPKVYGELDIEYFEKAALWLVQRPEVSGGSVGLCGISMGGSICLAMAQFLGPLVAAVVVLGANYVSSPGGFKYKKEVVEASTYIANPNTALLGRDGWLEGGTEMLFRQPERQVIFEKSEAPVLGIVGEEDEEMREIARFSFERAKVAGKLNCHLVELDGTGHLIDLPHSPLCKTASHPLCLPHQRMWYGGQVQPHALAQFKAWTLLTEFFDGHLKLIKF